MAWDNWPSPTKRGATSYPPRIDKRDIHMTPTYECFCRAPPVYILNPVASTTRPLVTRIRRGQPPIRATTQVRSTHPLSVENDRLYGDSDQARISAQQPAGMAGPNDPYALKVPVVALAGPWVAWTLAATTRFDDQLPSASTPISDSRTTD